MTTELIPNMPNELFKIQPTLPSVAGFVRDDLGQVAFGVDRLEVDCSVCDSIVKRWEIPEQLQAPRPLPSHGR